MKNIMYNIKKNDKNRTTKIVLFCLKYVKLLIFIDKSGKIKL